MRPRLDLYPGYDVLAKRDGPSWNAKTREVLEERLAIGPETRRFFDESEWPTIKAIAERIVPQPADRADPVPVAALVDHKLATDTRDGYRNAELPGSVMRGAWDCGPSIARHGHGSPHASTNSALGRRTSY